MRKMKRKQKTWRGRLRLLVCSTKARRRAQLGQRWHRAGRDDIVPGTVNSPAGHVLRERREAVSGRQRGQPRERRSGSPHGIERAVLRLLSLQLGIHAALVGVLAHRRGPDDKAVPLNVGWTGEEFAKRGKTQWDHLLVGWRRIPGVVVDSEEGLEGA